MTLGRKERITVTIDAGVLERVDAAAASRGESRSAVIERLVRNDIEREEDFLKNLESPVKRAILRAMTSSPRLVEMLAVIVGDQLETGDAERISRTVKEQAERARERQLWKNGSVEPEGA